MPEIASFVVEVSDPQDAGISQSKSLLLRFTLTWVLDHPKYGKLGDSSEGCLCYLKKDGTLRWSPHKVRTGPKRTKQLHWVTPAYYNLVQKLLEKEWGEYLKTPAFDIMSLTKSRELPADMPRVVRAEEESVAPEDNGSMPSE